MQLIIFSRKKTELIDYRINSVTEGTDAQAEVHVNLLIEVILSRGLCIDHVIYKPLVKHTIKYMPNILQLKMLRR